MIKEFKVPTDAGSVPSSSSLSSRPQIILSSEAERETARFALDALVGLTSKPKSLPSRYFYDSEGSRLFQRIMEVPEYYLTRCEYEILETCRSELRFLMEAAPFNLVELGAGDGLKTRLLLEEFTGHGLEFNYVPIDISVAASEQLADSLHREFPQLQCQTLVGEYFEGLDWIRTHSSDRSLVLFLGSNIGNFDDAQRSVFLKTLWGSLNHGDCVLIGFDLKKDLRLLQAAYQDQAGVTREFNLNVLRRMNRELQAEFDPSRFQHYATYNVLSGAMESHLVSLRGQDIRIGKIDKTIHFDAFESLHLEYSYKFLLSDIEAMAAASGFRILRQFGDRRGWFVDSLWQVVKPLH